MPSRHCPEKTGVLSAHRPSPAAGGRPNRRHSWRVATLGPQHSLSGSQEHRWVPRGHPRECSLCVRPECARDPCGLSRLPHAQNGVLPCNLITPKISLVSWRQETQAAPGLSPGPHPAFLLCGSYSMAPINCSPSSTLASVRTRQVNLGITAMHEPPPQLAHWGCSFT